MASPLKIVISLKFRTGPPLKRFCGSPGCLKWRRYRESPVACPRWRAMEFAPKSLMVTTAHCTACLVFLCASVFVFVVCFCVVWHSDDRVIFLVYFDILFKPSHLLHHFLYSLSLLSFCLLSCSFLRHFMHMCYVHTYEGKHYCFFFFYLTRLNKLSVFIYAFIT